MRVCLVCFQAYPLFNPDVKAPIGGTEIQMSMLARFLSGRGIEIDMIVGDHGQESTELRDGIRLLRSVEPSPASGLFGRSGGFTKFVRTLARSRAQVYVASPASPQVGITALFCRLARRKFIYRTAHQFDCDGVYEAANGWRGRLYGFGLRKADAVVTQNDDHRRILAERGIGSQVIRNGFALPEAPASAAREVDALWVARCEAWKNPHLFLDLAEQLPTGRFRMICPREAGLEDLFEEVARRAGALPNVSFADGVDFARIQAEFDAAKLLVSTSEYEGFPNTFLQACIAGTPVASYKVDPDGAVTRHGIGSCAQGDFAAMTEQVRRLLTDADEWRSRSADARRYVETFHDIRRQGEQWAELVASLAPTVR